MAATVIDRERLAAVRAREQAEFDRRTQRSAELAERARRHLPDGVPMAWMAGLYDHRPLYVAHGDACRLTDLDGNGYVDFNHPDPSAPCGFAPPAVHHAIAASTASRCPGRKPGKPNTSRSAAAGSVAHANGRGGSGPSPGSAGASSGSVTVGDDTGGRP